MRQGVVAAALRMRYVRRDAPVAQLDRALPSEGRGQGFGIPSGAPFRDAGYAARITSIDCSAKAYSSAVARF